MKQKLLLAYSYKNKVNVFSRNILSVSKTSSSTCRITFSDTLDNLDISDTFFNYSCKVKTRNNKVNTYKNNLPVRVIYPGPSFNYIDINVLNSEFGMLGLTNDDIDMELLIFNDTVDNTSHYDFLNVCINSSTVLAKSRLFSGVTFDNSVLTDPVLTCNLSNPIDLTKKIVDINMSGVNWGHYIYYTEFNTTQIKIYLKTSNNLNYFTVGSTERNNINILIYS